jgi:hypothetical protein
MRTTGEPGATDISYRKSARMIVAASVSAPRRIDAEEIAYRR